MPTLYLHVGLHKTATTSLQQFLYANRAELRESGFEYPEYLLSDSRAHHLIAATIKGKHPKAESERNFRSALDGLSTLTEGRSVILSSEMFSEYIHMELMGIAREYFKEISVILYVKRQDILRESIYNQVVKDGHECCKFSESKKYNYDYEVICERWSKVFGDESIILRPFERKQFRGKNIYRDFLNAVGIVDTDNFKIPSGKKNRSLPSAVIEFVKASNEFDKIDHTEFVEFCSGLFDLNAHDDVLRSYQSPYERKTFLELHAESNERVARRYLKRDDGVLFYEPPPDLNTEWLGPDELTARTAVRVAVEIWNHYKLNKT